MTRKLIVYFSLAKLRELVRKELGLTSMVLIDQKTGVDLSSALAEEPLCVEKRKQIVSNFALNIELLCVQRRRNHSLANQRPCR